MEKGTKKVYVHRLKSMGPNPYGYMCYCQDCGKSFGNYKDPKTSLCGIEYHCLYAGLCEGGPTECLFLGMDGVDAICSGYVRCREYEPGSRKCEEEQ